MTEPTLATIQQRLDDIHLLLTETDQERLLRQCNALTPEQQAPLVQRYAIVKGLSVQQARWTLAALQAQQRTDEPTSPVFEHLIAMSARSRALGDLLQSAGATYDAFLEMAGAMDRLIDTIPGAHDAVWVSMQR